MKTFRLLIILITLICISGCQLAVPFIQGFKDVGFTESDRVQLFSKKLTDFNHSLTDGDRTRMLVFAADDYKNDFREIIRRFGKNEKLVSNSVDLVDFREESKKAEVEVITRYFRQTDYIVRDRLVKQEWEFTTGTGWMLTGYSVLNDDYK